MLLFVAGDGGFVEQRHADLVEPMHPPMAAEWLELKSLRQTEIIGDGLSFEVDGEVIRAMAVSALGDALDGRLRQFDNEQTVIAGVVAEDVGERWREDYSKAEFSECPGCVLARGSTAEILSGHQNCRIAKVLTVEHEVFAIAAIGMVTPVGEQESPKPGALNPLQVLLGNNLIGIDIVPMEGSNHATMFANRLHASSCTPNPAHRQSGLRLLQQQRFPDLRDECGR